MGEGRIMQEQLSRATHGAVAEGGITGPLALSPLRGSFFVAAPPLLVEPISFNYLGFEPPPSKT
jgi:hypothetical protein